MHADAIPTTPTTPLARAAHWLVSPAHGAPPATLLIRLMAGLVFLSEGIIKFLFANQGVGRFTKLGFPMPELTATGIAVFEIVGGLLLVAGLYTRLVALGFSIEMVVAIATTKISIGLGSSPLGQPGSPPQTGIWAVLHEGRTDWCMLVGCTFLAIVGAGARSLDARR
jgi:putative oxidoreductase